MKHFKHVLLLFSVLATLGWCAHNLANAQTTEAPPEDPAQVLAKGQQILAERCALCHIPPQPTDYTQREWPSIIQTMGQKATLRPAEMKALTAYIEHALSGEEPLEPSEAGPTTE